MRRFLLITGMFAVITSAAEMTKPDELADGFRSPPDAAKPLTWWHWMDGNVTKEGITLDLEAMKRGGLGGAQFFDAGLGTPDTGLKTVAYRSPEWIALVKHAAAESKRLGLELGLNGCAGWSVSGGTWVKPAEAMRKMVWSQTRVKGPGKFSGVLPQPPGTFSVFQDAPLPVPITNETDYADAAVMAYRLPTGAQRMVDAKPKLSSNVLKHDVAALADGKFGTKVSIPGTKTKDQPWVQFEFAEPFTCRAVTMLAASGQKPLGLLQVSDDGTAFRTVTNFGFAASFRYRVPTTVVLKPVTARFFRLQFQRMTGPLEIAELELNGEAMVDDWPLKAGFELPRELTATSLTGTAIRRDDVVNLTGQMRADGQFDWDVPAGEWVVLRIGHSPTGHRNGPAPKGADGLECDKLSGVAVTAFFNGFIEPLKAIGLRSVLLDSWEAGNLNWTPKFIAEFTKRRGYNPTAWLPVMTGRVVESAELSERFLWDVRRTIGDLIADEHYGTLNALCRERGLTLYAEAAGVGLAMTDQLQCKGRVDVPMGEFWHPNPDGRYDDFNNINTWDSKEAASGAHIYGKKIVATESFTSGGRHGPWQAHPFEMKAQADFMFCRGVNRFIYHTYAHQPWIDRAPAMTMGPYGIHFGRTVTWWDHGGREFQTYIARCQYLLQQGLPVADVAVFVGEGVPAAVRLVKDALKDFPTGYDYDGINAEALLTRATAKDGKLVLPDGLSYRVLLMPTDRVTPAVARKLKELANAGVKIVGTKPVGSPSLASYPECDDEVKRLGAVVSEQVLTAVLPAPDFATSNTNLTYIHRMVGDAEIYFVSNQKYEAADAECTFRVAGKAPELWQPDTGKMEPAAFTVTDGRTSVLLHFDPAGSVFVVFRKPGASVPAVKPVFKEQMLTGPWRVKFGGRSVAFEKLTDWSKNADPEIKYFSGTATYAAEFEIGDLKSPVFLDLGAVKEIAEVTLNGQSLGALWKPPFRMEINRAAKPGKNRLEVQVTNLWVNRLIGDAGLPVEQRVGMLVFPNPYKKDSPLFPSGLLGPVTLRIVQ